MLAKLHDAINKAHEMAEVRDKFLSNQMIPMVSPTIDDAKKWNSTEIERWRGNYKNSGIDLK